MSRLFTFARAALVGITLVGALTWSAGTTQSALAQPGAGGGRGGGGGGGRMGGMGGFMGATMSGRQLDSYSKMLNMTEDQKFAAEALLEGYQGQIRADREKMQKQMEEVRRKFEEDRDPAVWESMRTAGEQMRTARKKLDEGLMSDIKSLLTPQQAEKWPAVERAQRRDNTVNRGLISGERVNLFQIVENLKLPEDALKAASPILDEYDVDLDRALIARNTVFEEGIQRFMGGRPGEANMEEMQKSLEKGREASVRVRDVNRKYARQLQEVLPEANRPAFDAAFKQASFPDVYRPTQTQRSFDAALQLADLTETQRESIRLAKESHDRSMASINEKLAAAQEETEAKVTVQGLMQRFGRGSDRGDQGPMADLRRERRDLAETSLEGLKKILSPEQAAKLPQRDDRDGGGWRGGGDQMDQPQRRRERGNNNDRT